MTRIGDLVRTFWAVPDELLVADLWRFAVLVGAAVAFLAVLLQRRRRAVSPWTAAGLVAALALLAASISSRPASLEAAGLVAAAGVVAAPVVALAARKRRASQVLVSAALIGLVGATAAFHATWFASASERGIALEEMRRRPADPWPRGTGHTMLSVYAAPAEQRGWLEAGGSFSPALKSFGVSIWVTDRDGRRIATSDDIDLADTRQLFRRGPDGSPRIEVATPYYTALWQVLGKGGYALDLRDQTPPGASLELVVRSVGPAGGPLRQIVFRPRRLDLDDGWTITLPLNARLVCLGDERVSALAVPCAGAERVTSREGWAFARVSLGEGTSRLELRPPAAATGLPAFPAPAGLALSGFPGAFADRLDAQAATLLAGIVGDQTRPGDPINYPLSWQRDGAYMLVALARAGYAEQARPLSRKFAEDDFFGGFGSEADAPGLALWALAEVAGALRDPAFDARIWNHVERKARLIEAMLATTKDLRAPYSGPVVPRAIGRADLDLVAGPAEAGLIKGRMDWQWPVFYVNAVSYLGLVEAAALATRLGHDENAAKWSELAASIRSAYRNRMASLRPGDAEAANPRTTISGLWPADIAEPARFGELLQRRWAATRAPDGSFIERPLWTYFSFAEAHQWLRLGAIGPVLQTLDWFDAHDVIPGLQVYWEGAGEENSFGGWRDVRGNLEPRGVTPHFWASAEALLLSIEMLAYVDQDRTRLTIGAGVPSQWLAQPLSARDVGTSVGPVSWRWDGARCVEVVAPAGLAIALGSGFPRDALIARAPARACPDRVSRAPR